MELYGGIDLHSNTSTVSIITKARQEVALKRLDNDIGLVLSMLEPYREDLVGIAVESTYNWYWLVDGLMDNGYQVHLANMNEAQQYKGLKHRGDRHDANWIAFLLALGILAEGYIYPKKDRPLRDLCRRRAFLVRSRTRMFNSTRAVFESWTGDRLTRNEMKGWTDDDLEQLIEDSRTRLGISCMLEPVLEMNHQIELIEKKVLEEAVLREEFKLLETVWGIGKILALTVMYEVGDISRFPSVGNFSSYCRLVDSKYLSNGKRKGKGNVKNGNPYLSWAFSEAAHFAVAKYPEAKRFYQRKKAASPHEMVAKRALAAKLARASFYVMRDKVEFDPAKLFR
jgi:transposase